MRLIHVSRQETNNIENPFHTLGYIAYPECGLLLYMIVWMLLYILKTGPTRNSIVCVLIASSFFCWLTIWAFSLCLGDEMCPWQTGSWPQTFRGCSARVNIQQLPLFSESIYQTQFYRVRESRDSWSNFNMEQSLHVRGNETLCGQGFQGNADLYGLGTRIGIYLQWLACLIVNNFLPEDRKGLQRMYLATSMVLCLATFVASFLTSCVFAVEVEILYWIYWGGVLSVYAFSPSSTRLGSTAQSV